MILKVHLKYLRYVLRHKWFVFRECCRLGIPLQGLIHDWSKFLPSEWFPYAEYFYGGPHRPLSEINIEHQVCYGAGRWSKEAVESDFDKAWLLHQKRNPHHWQWWVLTEDNPQRRYCIQAIQPEFGPYYLFDTERQKQVAQFGFGLNCEEGAYESAEWKDIYAVSEEVDRKLNRSAKALPMPDRYRREMLADWRGAGLALGNPDTRAWYEANKDKMALHPETRRWIECQLGLINPESYEELCRAGLAV